MYALNELSVTDIVNIAAFTIGAVAAVVLVALALREMITPDKEK